MDKVDGSPAPNADNAYYSTAFNFLDHIRGSVDPRTGMYSASVNLATGDGNRLRGPSFEFSLAYSPLDPSDEGFGEGWHLRMTQLDEASRVLSLASGERFTADVLVPGRAATFHDRKLETFILTPGAGLSTARIDHVTGLTEYLAFPGHLGATLRPVRMEKQTGEGINFRWEGRPGGPYRLARIEDDDEVELLSLQYAASDETILSIAGSPGSPAAQFRFIRAQDLLRHIELTTVRDVNAYDLVSESDAAAWRFEYENALAPPLLRLLTKVVHPTGITEQVHYNEHALRLPPGAPRESMPAVDTRIQRRTSQPADIIEVSHYAYDAYGVTNFYGYPVVTSWSAASDQLLHLVGKGAFRYGSVERRLGIDQTTLLLSIKRTYNQFHLPVEEITARGKVVSEVVTQYGDVLNEPFVRQPRPFQLPHRVTTTLYDTSSPAMRMVTYETTDYDDAGNIVKRFDSATGITEVSTHFPESGETDASGAVLCPPDPLGLVRRLKKTVIEPGGAGEGQRIKCYQYRAIDARPGFEGVEGRYYVQATCDVTLVHAGDDVREMERLERAFVDDMGPWHGCILHESHIRDGVVRQLSYDYIADDLTVTTTTSLTVNGAPAATQSESLYRISGLVALEMDAHGNRRAHGYDAMGRLTSTVVHPDLPEYRREVRIRYQVSVTARWVEKETRPGYIDRTWLDERGLPILIESPLEDGSPVFVSEHWYNTLGQVVAETTYDRVDGGRVVGLTTHYTYSDWGHVGCIIRAVGSEEHHDTSLVRASGSEGVCSQTVVWIEANGERLDWTATDTNEAGQKIRVGLGRWDRRRRLAEDAFESWGYDGYGRCVVFRDIDGRESRQAWDNDDRLVATTFHDGTEVRRRYAAASSRDDMAAISVVTTDGSAFPLGENTYDDMFRVTSMHAGSLAYRFEYSGPGPYPARQVQPSGAVMAMRRDRCLNHALLDATLAEPGEEPILTASATYDRSTGAPTRFSSASATVDVDADRLGRFVGQVTTINGDKARATRAVPSQAGRVLEQQLADGASQHFVHDDLGRVVMFSDTDVTVTFAYDAFSRPTSRTAYASGKRVLIDTKVYDGRGRVVSQVWLHRHGDVEVGSRLELDWRIDNKLGGRRWYRAATRQHATERVLGADGGPAEVPIREETFSYDGRGRLSVHDIASATGDFPKDEAGRPYAAMFFEHDALDNLVRCETVFASAAPNEITRYAYDPVDVDRLVAYTQGDGAPVMLSYDTNGNVIDDGRGMTLGWDGAGRLAWVRLPDGSETYYSHGPDGRVCATWRGERMAFRHYSDGVLVYEGSDSEGRRYIRVAGRAVAECVLSGAIREACLLGVDAQGSVVMDDGGTGAVRDRAYGAYGYHPVDRNDVRLGFAGEVLEEEAPFYLLGTRAYSPVLRRFLCPDPASPFGEGGLNRYAYCGGDPINRIDPSGQSWLDWLVAIGSLVASVVAAVATGGALIGAVGAAAGMVSTMGMVSAVSAAVLDTVALAVDIGAVAALATGDAQAWQILGTIGMVTGLASFGASTAIKSAGKATGKLAGKGASKGGRAGRMSCIAHHERPAPDLTMYAGKPGIRRAESIEELPKYTNSEGKLRPIPQWSEFRKSTKGGQSVHYAANSPVTSKHVESQLKAVIASSNEQSVYVYSGAHGVPDGANWKGQQRRPSLNEKELFERDEAKLSSPGVTFVDMTKANEVDDYVYYWDKPGIHIHGFCFAAVDVELLGFFGITEKVTVYI